MESAKLERSRERKARYVGFASFLGCQILASRATSEERRMLLTPDLRGVGNVGQGSELSAEPIFRICGLTITEFLPNLQVHMEYFITALQFTLTHINSPFSEKVKMI